MTNPAETVQALGSPATRARSSATRSRRMAPTMVAATIGIAVIAGCGDDEDTTGSTITDDDSTTSTVPDEDTTDSTEADEADDGDEVGSSTAQATPPSSGETGTTGEASSPADHDVQFACGLIQHWGGQQAIDQYSVYGYEMLGAILAAAGAASAAGDERYGGFIVDDVADAANAPGSPDIESVGIDALVNACADVGYEIDEDAPKDGEAATEIAEMICEAAGRWDDEWTLDDVQDEMSQGIQPAEAGRRIAVARAAFALSGYDEQYEGLGDAGSQVTQALSMLREDTFQDGIDAIHQECQTVTAG